ncbi:hypothetical protein JCM11491_003539 [Sporobolomyces phaffii]
MPAANMSALAATMEALGLSPQHIDSIMRDPAALSRLQSLGHLDAQSRYHTPQSTNVRADLDSQMAQARKAYAEELSRPHRKPPANPRFAMIASLEAEYEATLESDAMPGTRMLTTYVGLPKSFSDKPLYELEQIGFNEMEVSKAHKGRYLVCRIVSHPHLKIAICFAVEDPSGRVEYFSLYNYPLYGHDTGPDLNALFPLGTILVVREPMFKMNQNNSGPLVRVDSPSDIRVVAPTDPLVASIRWAFPSPATAMPQDFDFKAHGNSHFKSKKFRLAVKAYTDGLATTSWLEQQLVLQLNRAQAHLGLGNFYQALQDASGVLSLLEDGIDAPVTTKEKATLRRSRAFEGLRQFTRALESYEELLANFPDSAEARAGVARVRKLLRQSKTGEFEWLELNRAVNTLDSRRDFIVGDFVGTIEVKSDAARGGGRGIFATKDIKPGDLLLVETSFATGRTKNDKKRLVMAFDLRDHSVVDQQRLDLYEKVVAKALDDPSSLTALYGLYGGESFPPSSTPTLEGEPEPVSVPSADLDIARIESITSINCFGGSGIPVEQEAKAGSTSLFVKASLFNHQCTSNASWSTYNNVMVVRARTPIASGEEIFLTYRTVGFQAPIIEKHLGKDGCGCPLCTFDRLEGPVAVEKRKKLVRDQLPSIKSRLAETMMPSPAHARLVRELERVIADIEKTYSSSRPERFRVELSEPLNVLADSQQFQLSDAARQRSVDLTVRSHVVRDGGISIKGGKVTVTRAPIELGSNSVSTLLVCARRFAFRNDPDENVIALQWIQAAMDLEKMLSGGGYAVFRLRQDDAIRRLELDHLVDLLRP